MGLIQSRRIIKRIRRLKYTNFDRVVVIAELDADPSSTLSSFNPIAWNIRSRGPINRQLVVNAQYYSDGQSHHEGFHVDRNQVTDIYGIRESPNNKGVVLQQNNKDVACIASFGKMIIMSTLDTNERIVMVTRDVPLDNIDIAVKYACQAINRVPLYDCGDPTSLRQKLLVSMPGWSQDDSQQLTMDWTTVCTVCKSNTAKYAWHPCGCFCCSTCVMDGMEILSYELTREQPRSFKCGFCLLSIQSSAPLTPYWSPSQHMSMTQHFRSQIITIMLCRKAHSYNTCSIDLSSLPIEMMFIIFELLLIIQPRARIMNPFSLYFIPKARQQIE
jgi:hypothetical protein